ncbi:MAG: hypothetical protein H7331_12590 [Bacteroidia bacterium]|nr:hypothetical protein [Bacteroidia bacterium]
MLFLSSCELKREKFNSKRWIEIDVNTYYKQREPIVNDLMENYLHNGMSYNEIINLLGKPEIQEENNLIGYTLELCFGLDIDPVESRNLMMQLSKDLLLKEFKIEEWKR